MLVKIQFKVERNSTYVIGILFFLKVFLHKVFFYDSVPVSLHNEGTDSFRQHFLF